jgi:hypothetical protein
MFNLKKMSNMLEKYRKLLISSDFLFQLIWTSYGVDRAVLVSNAFWGVWVNHYHKSFGFVRIKNLQFSDIRPLQV